MLVVEMTAVTEPKTCADEMTLDKPPVDKVTVQKCL